MFTLITLAQMVYLRFQEYNDSDDFLNKRCYFGFLLKSPINPYNAEKPYIIGITGGIASGKTTVRNELEKLGYATLDCDKLGHKTYEKNKTAYKKLIKVFGEDILSEDRSISRSLLGKKVFEKPEELKKLTDIVWPEIINLMNEEVEILFKKFNHKVIFVEAALLIEASWYQYMNEVWVCWIPEKEACRRATSRDNVNVEDVQKRIKNQMKNNERVKYANILINTIGNQELVKNQVNNACCLLKDRLNVSNFNKISEHSTFFNFI